VVEEYDESLGLGEVFLVLSDYILTRGRCSRFNFHLNDGSALLAVCFFQAIV
jgi:hypothetical protein